jgi:hypothetical protein
MRSPQAFEIAGFSAANRNCSSAVGMSPNNGTVGESFEAN